MKPRAYALYLLNKRAYTKEELKKKLLNKGFDLEEVEPIIEACAEAHWVDDQVYAEHFIESQMLYGRKSPKEISYKLREKGVDSSIYQSLLKEIYSQEEELKVIEYLIDKALRTQRVSREKLLQRLTRKGFSFNCIIHVLEEKGL